MNRTNIDFVLSWYPCDSRARETQYMNLGNSKCAATFFSVCISNDWITTCLVNKWMNRSHKRKWCNVYSRAAFTSLQMYVCVNFLMVVDIVGSIMVISQYSKNPFFSNTTHVSVVSPSLLQEAKTKFKKDELYLLESEYRECILKITCWGLSYSCTCKCICGCIYLPEQARWIHIFGQRSTSPLDIRKDLPTWSQVNGNQSGKIKGL